MGTLLVAGIASPFASVSFVITRAFGLLRLVRFASATSGESAAETVAARSRMGMIVFRMR